MADSLESTFSEQAAVARRKARVALGTRYDLQSVAEPNPRFVEAWRVPLKTRFSDHLLIKVSARFPLELPNVYVEENLFEVCPHVDRDGLVCYVDKSVASYDPDDVEAVTLWVVEEAAQVLNQGDPAETAAEFAAEFLSYWQADPSFLSLLTEFDEPRLIDLIWLDAQTGSFSFLVCEDAEAGVRWLENSGIQRPTARSQAVFLPELLMPSPPYPRTNRELFERIQIAGARERRLWENYLKPNRTTSVVVSTVDSVRGKSLIAWKHGRIPYPHSRDASGAARGQVNGFRPGKEPIGLEMTGWGATEVLQRYSGTRVDLPRLVARTLGETKSPTFKHLVVVGVGALGSHMLESACAAHVFERISIIDPDILGVENVLRYAAGFDKVGRYKAEVMAERIKRKCPWIQVDVVPANVLDSLDAFEGWLETADLVVLATGARTVEEALVSMIERRCQPHTAVHQIWVTAKAAEGHLVRYVRGTPRPPWAGSDPVADVRTLEYEPGCNAGFGTFGGSPLQRFVAEATDALLRPVEQSWHLLWTPRSEPVVQGEIRISA